MWGGSNAVERCGVLAYTEYAPHLCFLFALKRALSPQLLHEGDGHLLFPGIRFSGRDGLGYTQMSIQ